MKSKYRRLKNRCGYYLCPMSALRISAVICTYNREKYIGQALEALRVQELPYSQFELVLVNNNSTDRSWEIMESFRAAHPEMQITLVNEEDQGLSHARNRGFHESRMELVTYLDDDAIAPPGFLAACIRYFAENPDMMALGGKIIPEFVDGKPRWYTRYFWGVTGQFDPGNEAGKMLYWGKFPCGSNMTFTRDFFERYGLFNPNLGRKGAILLAGEEKELFSRVKTPAEKDRVLYFPDLVVYHCVDHTKLNPVYLKRFAVGFAKGEKLEVEKAGFGVKVKRYVSLSAKCFGTGILFWRYALVGEFSKATMILRFGWWIFGGLWWK